MPRPAKVGRGARELIATRADNVRAVAADLQARAEAEVERLRSLGWTQTDFAGALRRLLENKEPN